MKGKNIIFLLIIAIAFLVTGIATAEELISNHPCRFKRGEGTTFIFNLPEDAKVTLVVYNMAGQIIRTFCDSIQYAKGKHEIFWDGTDDSGMPVEAGIYPYFFRAGDKTLLKKTKVLSTDKKTWMYISLFDVSVGAPYILSGYLCRLAIGFAPPLGFGIGTAGFEMIPKGGLVPLYLYYIPYAHWNKKRIAETVVYSCVSFNTWLVGLDDLEGATYMRASVGINKTFIIGGETIVSLFSCILPLPRETDFPISVPVSIMAETGYYLSKDPDYDISESTPYIGVTLSVFSGWLGFEK